MAQTRRKSTETAALLPTGEPEPYVDVFVDAAALSRDSRAVLAAGVLVWAAEAAPPIRVAEATPAADTARIEGVAREVATGYLQDGALLIRNSRQSIAA